ncbi:Laminin subunit alpha-2 [Trichinella zimbabwensis]|uniref:Laminin subunit alpha-2 n=1 Tax=Trichinella zimbabwensis TaxID=268475 RepID=A0A0V1I7G4_9BILA|nr:Laminin subunit alpha-2 [Trichinella zimbabwensis]
MSEVELFADAENDEQQQELAEKLRILTESIVKDEKENQQLREENFMIRGKLQSVQYRKRLNDSIECAEKLLNTVMNKIAEVNIMFEKLNQIKYLKAVEEKALLEWFKNLEEKAERMKAEKELILKNKNEELDMLSAETAAMVEAHEKQMSELQHELEGLRMNNENIKESNDAMKVMLKNAEDEIKLHENEIRKIEANIEQTKEKSLATKDRNARLQVDIEKAKRRVINLTSTCDKLQKNIDEHIASYEQKKIYYVEQEKCLKERLDKINSQIAKIEFEKEILSKKSKDCFERNQRLQAEINNERNRFSELMAKLNDARKYNCEQNEKMNTVKKNIQEMKLKEAELEKAIEAETGELERLTKINDDTVKTLQMQDEEIAILEAKIVEKQNELNCICKTREEKRKAFLHEQKQLKKMQFIRNMKKLKMAKLLEKAKKRTADLMTNLQLIAKDQEQQFAYITEKIAEREDQTKRIESKILEFSEKVKLRKKQIIERRKIKEARQEARELSNKKRAEIAALKEKIAQESEEICALAKYEVEYQYLKMKLLKEEKQLAYANEANEKLCENMCENEILSVSPTKNSDPLETSKALSEPNLANVEELRSNPTPVIETTIPSIPDGSSKRQIGQKRNVEISNEDLNISKSPEIAKKPNKMNSVLECAPNAISSPSSFRVAIIPPHSTKSPTTTLLTTMPDVQQQLAVKCSVGSETPGNLEKRTLSKAFKKSVVTSARDATAIDHHLLHSTQEKSPISVASSVSEQVVDLETFLNMKKNKSKVGTARKRNEKSAQSCNKTNKQNTSSHPEVLFEENTSLGLITFFKTPHPQTDENRPKRRVSNRNIPRWK